MPATDPLHELLAPRGSAWYYATLHLPPRQRRPLLLLQAWWRAVSAVPATVSDPLVAAAKLGWWQAQLRAVDEAAAEHPLLRELQPALQPLAGATALLRQALDSVPTGAPPLREDWPQLHRELLGGSGNVARVALRLAGCEQPAALEHAAELAAALDLLRLLRDVGRDARRQQVRLPRSLLRAHGLHEQQLLDLHDSPQLRAALRQAAQVCNQRLQAAESLRPGAMGRAGRLTASLSAMGFALLREIEAADDTLLQQRISLPPLRLLWVAWRARWLRRAPAARAS